MSTYDDQCISMAGSIWLPRDPSRMEAQSVTNLEHGCVVLRGHYGASSIIFKKRHIPILRKILEALEALPEEAKDKEEVA